MIETAACFYCDGFGRCAGCNGSGVHLRAGRFAEDDPSHLPPGTPCPLCAGTGVCDHDLESRRSFEHEVAASFAEWEELHGDAWWWSMSEAEFAEQMAVFLGGPSASAWDSPVVVAAA